MISPRVNTFKRMVPLLVLVALVLVPCVFADEPQDSLIPEPSVKVETYPHWKSGDLAIYIMDFPSDGGTYTQSSIRFRVAVWGASPEDPIVILLNGEEAARIEGEGLFTYEWSLMGSHHLLIRCRNRIFEQAQFNIKAPPPPPATKLLTDYYAELKQQRTSMMLISLAATLTSIPTGIWVKRKTKITTMWVMVPFSIFPLMGIRYPSLYMLIPYGLGAALVYWLAREYADYMAITVIEEGGMDTDVYPLDDEGRVILDVDPRYWRTRFMHTKPIELVDNRFPINFRFKGTLLRCITVKGRQDIKETRDQITVKCSPALARSLSETKVIEQLQDQLADTRFQLIFMERGLRSVVAHAVTEMEQIIEDSLLDDVATIPEAKKRVQQATDAMKDAIVATEQPQPTEVPAND